jgi:hypothetical protein
MRFLLAWCGHDNHDPANRSRHMAVAAVVPANACDAAPVDLSSSGAGQAVFRQSRENRRGSGVGSSGATALTAILKEPPADRTGWRMMRAAA